MVTSYRIVQQVALQVDAIDTVRGWQSQTQRLYEGGASTD